MKRIWLLGAGIAVLALIGWVIAARDTAPAPRTGATLATPAVPEPVDSPPLVMIELLLLPDGAVRAVPGSVRVGVGYVSTDDAARAPVRPDAEGPQADSSRYDELAVVARWVPAPAQLLADGRVKIGPLRLPRADRYTLQARGEDGLHFYLAGFTPNAVPATVAPLVGAGVRTHAVSDGASVLLRRASSSAAPTVWQHVQNWIAPELLEAFSEQPLPVQSGQVLAPLAPGPVEVILQVNGVEAERRLLSLQAGRVLDVHFDPTNQAVARAVSMDLELEFVGQGDGKPVQGLRVDWLSGRMQQGQATDARGRVKFAGVDRQQVHQFNLQAATPKEQLPDWPELRPLQIAPDDLTQTGTPGEVVHHRVELVPLRWLIARLPPEAMRTSPGRGSPYPIHVLQRQQNGRWMDASADHFIATPDGLAVSIADSGTYRVAAALSPWRVLESSAAKINGSTKQTVAFANAHGSDVTVSVMRDGKPLVGAPVHVIGPVGHLPPAVLRADDNGRVTLAAATVPFVRVEVPGSDQVEVRLAGTHALVDFGVRRPE